MNVNEIVATLEELLVRVNSLEKKFAAIQATTQAATQTCVGTSADGKTQA